MTTPTAKRISEDEFNALTRDAQAIEQDSHGIKVFELPDSEYLKLFRRKRLLSSALLTPYSVRFWNNAERLMALGIPTVTPLELYRLPKTGWTAVRYRALDGQTLKSIYQPGQPLPEGLLEQLAALFRELHAKGVYFRSLHLGNVVLTPEGELGLIDIADMRFQRRRLSRGQAKRNLAHFERYLRYNGHSDDFPMDELRVLTLAPPAKR